MKNEPVPLRDLVHALINVFSQSFNCEIVLMEAGRTVFVSKFFCDFEIEKADSAVVAGRTTLGVLATTPLRTVKLISRIVVLRGGAFLLPPG